MEMNLTEETKEEQASGGAPRFRPGGMKSAALLHFLFALPSLSFNNSPPRPRLFVTPPFTLSSSSLSLMFSRLGQVARHLTRPSLNLHSTPTFTSPSLTPPLLRAPSPKMTSSVLPKNKRTIHTAACLIIGDEVLGGKVRSE